MFEFGYSLPIIVVLFLITAFALSRLLFKPMQAILDERERRTSGTLQDSEKDLQEYTRLFEAYKSRVKQAQLEAYGLQDNARAAAAQYRAQRLAESREKAESVILRMKDELRQQVAQSRDRLKADAEELSSRIAEMILQKSA
jgi:F-type H+-transporting ATPase subunit b